MMNNVLDLQTLAGDRRRDEEAKRPPEFSDEALALQFASQYAEALRYVPVLGKWFRYDDRRWCIDDTLLARHYAREVCRESSARCADPRLAKVLASAKTVAAVERLAQADRRLVAALEQFDANPWVLNTPDFTIDLRTGASHAHRPHDYLTKITGTAPDRDCPTPNWDGFLDRATNGNRELAAFLQRAAGYSLTGSTREHALFFLFGYGANGKSTFLNAITAAMGEYHRTAPIETFTAALHDRHPTDLAGLRGARLITSVETEEGRRWAESRIKSLTGGDPISARFMRQDFFEYVPQFKLIIAGNHKPGLRSVDEAIRRRFNLIPFTVTIPAVERDPALPTKLTAELPGILAWMIDGCVEWREHGLSPPEVVTRATANYLASEDSVSAWIEDCASRDQSAWERSAVLYASWSAWAASAGEHAGTVKRFGQNLEQRGAMPERHYKLGRGYRGLRLRETGCGS